MTEAHDSINKIISIFYESFDNRNGRLPNFSRFQSCFEKGSSIGNRSDEEVRIWSLHDFWEPRYELLTGGRLREFHEWETAFETHVFNGIAMRHSSYQKNGKLDGLPYAGAGTKCFHLALTPEGWRITNVLWEDQE